MFKVKLLESQGQAALLASSAVLDWLVLKLVLRFHCTENILRYISHAYGPVKIRDFEKWIHLNQKNPKVNYFVSRLSWNCHHKVQAILTWLNEQPIHVWISQYFVLCPKNKMLLKIRSTVFSLEIITHLTDTLFLCMFYWGILMRYVACCVTLCKEFDLFMVFKWLVENST